MSRIVATNGTSIELQNVTDKRYWTEITVGGLDARATVRGENVTLPSAAGQVHMTKVEHEFPVTLHVTAGAVSGATYLQVMDALHAVFVIGEEVTLTLHPDAVGIGGRVPAGSLATTTVEVHRFTGPPALGDEVRTFDIECVGITDPLGWTVAAS